jgi:1-acyl-sn-glycerol-3-phosphate acyltransferase
MIESVIYASVRKLLSTITVGYFKEITVKGKKKLPVGSPVIFCANHPSGLLDPLVLMHVTKDEFQYVSSVAKHSLFTTPLVGFVIKAMRAVPVMKAYDPDLPPEKQPSPEERSRVNSEMFKICVQRIVKENTSIILFPEGETYTRPSLQELKTGAARLAITLAQHADATGGKRVPIVPVGLIHSHPSGFRFRQSILVDFGVPLHITDDQMKVVATGEEGMKKVAKEITDKLQSYLKDVTINIPDWCDELNKLCKARNLEPPTYHTMKVPGSENSVAVVCSVDGEDFFSKYYQAVSKKKGKSKKDSVDKLDDVAKQVEVLEVKKKEQLSLRQKRQAARRAFFQITGIDRVDSDWEIINTLHAVRRLYTPDGAKITLSQYALITQRLIDGYFLYAGEERVKQLWRDVAAYEEKLNYMGLKDAHLRYELSQDEVQNQVSKIIKENAAKLLVGLPLAVVGEVIHAPIALLAYVAGEREAISNSQKANDGDRSVEATMKLVGGFVGVIFHYPLMAYLSYYMTGSMLAPPLAIATGVLTGVAAINVRPSANTFNAMKAMLRVLYNRDEILEMQQERQELKRRIRECVDIYAPPNMERVFTSFMAENMQLKNRDDLDVHDEKWVSEHMHKPLPPPQPTMAQMMQQEEMSLEDQWATFGRSNTMSDSSL